MGIAANVQTVPHRGAEPWGLHLVAASDCEDFAEIVMGTRDAEMDVMWLGAPEQVNGYIELSESPGFGVSPNEDLL